MDQHGNTKLLRKDWEGERLRINGQRVTVKFDRPGNASVKCTLAEPGTCW